MNDPEDIFTVGPGMTLLEAYTKAIARVAELEAWQTGVCALIQTASMDGQSILPHELTDAIYHP